MDPLFTIKLLTTSGGRAEFVAAGELDASTENQLRTELVAVVAGGVSEIVIDLREVTFIDSSGLRGMIGAVKQGATVKLRGVQPGVRQLFDIVQVPGIDVEPS